MNIVNEELKELCYSEKQLKSFIHNTLSDYQPQTHLFSKKTSVAAAVLIPLFFKDGPGPFVVYQTHRNRCPS